MARTKKAVRSVPVKTAEQIEAERVFEERLSRMEQLARGIVRESAPRLIGWDKPNHWLREEHELRAYRNMLDVVLFLLVEGCAQEDVRAFLRGGDTPLKMLAGFWAEIWVRGSATPYHLQMAQKAHTGDLSPLVEIGWLDRRQIPDVLGTDGDDKYTRDRRSRARAKLDDLWKSLN